MRFVEKAIRVLPTVRLYHLPEKSRLIGAAGLSSARSVRQTRLYQIFPSIPKNFRFFHIPRVWERHRIVSSAPSRCVLRSGASHSLQSGVMPAWRRRFRLPLSRNDVRNDGGGHARSFGDDTEAGARRRGCFPMWSCWTWGACLTRPAGCWGWWGRFCARSDFLCCWGDFPSSAAIVGAHRRRLARRRSCDCWAFAAG